MLTVYGSAVPFKVESKKGFHTKIGPFRSIIMIDDQAEFPKRPRPMKSRPRPAPSPTTDV